MLASCLEEDEEEEEEEEEESNRGERQIYRKGAGIGPVKRIEEIRISA